LFVDIKFNYYPKKKKKNREMEETQRETKWCVEEELAEASIWKYVFGFTEMAVVKCAIELGIADVIESHGSPMTLSELSSVLACALSPLYRIMRFLMHRGIFKEELTAHGGYAQTALSRSLMRYGEHSMAAFIMLNSSPVVTASLHHLSACVLANEISPFEVAHGEDAWSFLAANPAHSQLVNKAMASNAKTVVPAIIYDCPEVFDGLGILVRCGRGQWNNFAYVGEGIPMASRH
jgi:hypothetical protein